MRAHNAMVLLALAAPAAGAAAAGLTVPPGAALWPQWQARITVSNARLAPVSLYGDAAPGTPARALQSTGALLGDYYFDAPGLRLSSLHGGWRATSGLVFGARGVAGNGVALPAHLGDALGVASLAPAAPAWTDAHAEDGAVPYVGFGYTGMSASGRWGFTADFGVVGQSLQGAGIGRPLLSRGEPYDATLGDLRLTPVLQFGVRYSF